MLLLLLLTALASVAAKPALRLGTVDLYTAWSFEATDCLATSCAQERVYNVFLDAAKDASASYCDWASAQARGNSSALWRAVGDAGVTLAAPAFVASLFGAQCAQTLAARAAELVQINGAAATAPVQVNVVELASRGGAASVTAANFGEFVCWRYPTTCGAADAERYVVNVFVANYCKSSCAASTPVAPKCFGADGCAPQGTCVAHNKCVCASGFAGPRCATRVGCDTDGCTNRGQCDAATGVCTCRAGFSGVKCELGGSTTPAAGGNNGGAGSGAGAGNAPAPAAHGATIKASDAWLAPFTIFPRTTISHWGELSYSQLPWRSNVQQNARRGLVQPRSTDGVIELYGFVNAHADYEKRTLTFDITITLPLRSPLKIGNQADNALKATLHNAAVGYTDAALATLPGTWCIVPSWIASEWPAFKLNGTVSFDAMHADALANGDMYVMLTQQDGTPTSRAQLSRVDEIYSGQLAGPAADYAGAAAFFVDARHNATHYWIYYTTPLTYVERGASVKLASVDGNVVPLPLGTTALRRIGVWVMDADKSRTTVCVLSKAGWYRLAADQLAALRSAELAVEAVGFGATVKGTINL